MADLKFPFLNQVILSGRLTRDSDLRYTTSRIAKLEIPLAISNRVKKHDGGYEDKTFFVDVAAWRELAEKLAPALKKGVPVIVDGALNIEEWTGKDGTQRRRAVINANRIQTLEWGVHKDKSNGDTPREMPQETQQQADLPTEDDLPF
jgi:single-strand DNA-binding protein